jgi:hypothetical protein
MGDACGRSFAGTRRQYSEPVGSARLMSSGGRHEATGRGRWPAVLASHPWRAASGTAVAAAALAGVVMIILPSHSPSPGTGGCGHVSCAGTQPSFNATASAHRSRPVHTANPGVAPSPKSQVASAGAPPARTSAGPSPRPTHDPAPGHSHPPPPSPSHPGKPTTTTTPTPTLTPFR